MGRRGIATGRGGASDRVNGETWAETILKKQKKIILFGHNFSNSK